MVQFVVEPNPAAGQIISPRGSSCKQHVAGRKRTASMWANISLVCYG